MYDHKNLKSKWQKICEDVHVAEDPSKKPYYILNMFPYPSGDGLHVGHALGYVASDVFARYKRLKGYNVLNPMGFDSFGLPAEQFAIQTGQHPAITTEINTKKYISQMKNMALSFDWVRMVNTSDISYYKHTQEIFVWMFNSFFCLKDKKAHNIDDLYDYFSKNGNDGKYVEMYDTEYFTAQQWNAYDTDTQYKISLHFRLSYLSEMSVNWCPQLKTVLANDEVKNGYSERGGYPVEQRTMPVWCLRITAYANRLLQGLDKLDWPQSTKEMQRNWIGESKGAYIDFRVQDKNKIITIFTTRPDTINDVTFIALSYKYHNLYDLCVDAKQVQDFITANDTKTDKKVGMFIGTYAIHPFTNKPLPIYIANYILDDYGTGAIMGVPLYDKRDKDFSTIYNIPSESTVYVGFAADNITQVIRTTHTYRLHDAVFGRQRYWGEPIPIFYKNNLPYVETSLPLGLPNIDDYTPTGEAPLAKAKNWHSSDNYPYETTTMPGWAGSSWYSLRYTDNNNPNELADIEKIKYWGNVDLYLGGAEHATGHLLYARFYNMFLYDIGKSPFEEPFQKLYHQGMILGESALAYRIQGTNTFVSAGHKDEYNTVTIHVHVKLVDKNFILDVEKFKLWRKDLADAEFIYDDDGKYHCGTMIEKMSKSKYNTINPDDIIDQYGTDCLRLYLMFLGPINQSKPWSTKGIEGMNRFLHRVWDLSARVTNTDPSTIELEILNKTIMDVENAYENYSFNTAISFLMVCLNKLYECNQISVWSYKQYLILLSCLAPYISYELLTTICNTKITELEFPIYDIDCVKKDNFEYPIEINGKVRFKMVLPLVIDEQGVIDSLCDSNVAKRWIQNKDITRIIIVRGKIINVII